MRFAVFLIEQSSLQVARHYTAALNSRFSQYNILVKITTHVVGGVMNVTTVMRGTMRHGLQNKEAI